ncbi:hypothetical protein HLB23_28400 [Nocardia uniformis]|uniref:Uncharacterized protein n=1 Tax=Nocardia uniformis TaxID=53432 RepID=A0A849CEF3_9NOCA|nr:hypothetical protein [Nocardia uniformis]NNH73729.1 hypothetical protein [Nocardia uniformis]
MIWSLLPHSVAGAYVGEALRSGLDLSMTALAARPLREYRYFAGISSDPSGSRLSDFTTGKSWPTVVGKRLADDLAVRFPSSQLVVEMPLAKPTDHFVENGADEGLVVWNDSVYAVCRLDEGPQRARSVLLEHDPSFLYNAFVIDGARPFPAVVADDTGDWLEVILIGAYDGEGVVGAFLTDIE